MSAQSYFSAGRKFDRQSRLRHRVNVKHVAKGRVLALTQTKINFPWISFKHYLTVLLHPVARTLANFNQNQFPLDFLHTFTGNFTLGNSNLRLTRSTLCFPSDLFYTILPHVLRA